ncbi:hypothetical protein ABZ934_19255 [Streptomyces sp. NPDC046557]|uniref:hypothetical protein n=1 Tax=Streptomyces sp. NPDC046557 TaxID=3155372 RepID=UPI0033D60681
MEQEQPLPASRIRAGRRAALLVAGALVLGAVAGTVTGYAVQYGRPPTPLPPLARQDLAMPAPIAANDATTQRTINANRWDKADEDLAKKLLDAPAGAQDAESGYESPDEFATDGFERPAGGFPSLIDGRVRRAAHVSWHEGNDAIDIRLIQFRERSGAQRYASGFLDFMPDDDYAGNSGYALPGVPAEFGHAWLSKVKEKPGYLPLRYGEAVVRRGDIVMDIKIVNKRADLSEGEINALAKRQLERL